MQPTRGVKGRRRGSCWEELQKIVFPRPGVIDLPSRQISYFLQKVNRIELRYWPGGHPERTGAVAFDIPHHFNPGGSWGYQKGYSPEDLYACLFRMPQECWLWGHFTRPRGGPQALQIRAQVERLRQPPRTGQVTNAVLLPKFAWRENLWSI